VSRRLALLILILAAAACSQGTDSTSDQTTTSLPEATTVFSFASPFLDVTEEPSNFTAGDVVAVVGLPADEQAWVGSFPADDVEFFGNLWPFDRVDAALVASGEAARYQDGPIWEKVGQEGKELAYFPQDNTGVLGQSEEVTADVADLEAASADELLSMVADAIAQAAGLEPIQISEREFGGREVYFDLLGGSEPTTRGQRLRVVVEEDGDGFVVALVESQVICVSRVTDEGTCS
jgi:hypothetical protein